MKAIDTHVHLDFPAYDKDRGEIITSLEAERIGVINIATDEASLEQVNKLSNDNKLIWGAIGLHPTEVSSETLINLDNFMNKLEKLFDGNPKLVAIGEIGLDYFHSKKHVGNQKIFLAEQLKYAQQKNIPVVFHCRDAYGDLLTILKHYPKLRGVIHCFSGTEQQAKGYLELGFHISFTGMITHKNNDSIRKATLEVPLDKLMLETDSPFLSPQSNRGNRNDPTAIIEIAQQHSALRNIPIEEILIETTNNAIKLFGLKNG